MKKVTDSFKLLYVVLCLTIIFVGNKFYNEKSKYHSPTLYEIGTTNDAPVSLKMYYLIEKYSKQYNIPKYVAYNVAYLETGYRGPFHWNYNPHQESFAGAVGPMQIMPSTGDYLTKGKSTKQSLKMDLELNVSLSMKLLRQLFDKYKNWAVVCGCYNTGYPIVNDYGHYCDANRDYISKWITFNNLKTPN